MNIINLTPHAISFEGNSSKTFNPSGDIARVSSSVTELKPLVLPCGAELKRQQNEFGSVENLPEPKPDTIFIVSGFVLSALQLKGVKRDDVIAPATGPSDNVIRSEKGFIVAVTRFNTL